MSAVEIEQSHTLFVERKQSIPENCERPSLALSTAADVDLREFFERLASFVSQTTPLWQFSGPDKIIYPDKPVSLNITWGQTLCFAENERLGIYTAGESREAAIKSFTEELLHFYEHYKNIDWNKVTGEALRLKKLYEQHFKEEKK